MTTDTQGVGAAVPRVEDHRLVRGEGAYVAHLDLPGALAVAFVRSPLAHGRLRGVDLDAARAVPGVVGAWSAADLPGLATVPSSGPPEVVRGRDWPALATDVVRFAGQVVAVVVADDRYAADDGVAAARLDVEALEALVDVEEAARSQQHVFDGLGTVAGQVEVGAVDEEVFASAAVVVEATYRHPRVAPSPMESRAIAVRPEPDGRVTVWLSGQSAHGVRDALARAGGLEPAAVRVVVPDVGGAFGTKSQTYGEYLVVLALARRLGRTLRWVEDRAEALTGHVHGRGSVQRVRLAADAEGRLLGYALDVDADLGAYPQMGATVAQNTAVSAAGAYRTPQVRVRARLVQTNLTPTTFYRGAGRPEATFAIERTMDVLARRLGMDPVELRRRNFVEQFPHTAPTGALYDSGAYAAALDLALEHLDVARWRGEQARRRASGGHPLGIGVSCYLERCGGGPAPVEWGSVEVRADGSVLAASGACSAGQGHETTFPQVVASVLGVHRSRVRLVAADTDQVPRGVGSFGSRSMQVAGEALARAAWQVLAEARLRMAVRCGCSVDQVSATGGVLVAGGQGCTLAELVEATGALRAEHVADPPESYSFGTHAAVVEVDPELGTVVPLRLVAVDDAGVVVNPLVVAGQVQGSVAQGLGQALYEQVPYGEDGLPRVRTLLDYLLPTAAEVPEVVMAATETPNPSTVLGAKGVGEAGCIGMPPALVNAVADALGVEDPDALQMPLTPAAVWAAALRAPAAGAAR